MTRINNAFPQVTVLAVAYSMLAVTSTVLLVRIGLNIKIPKKLTISDYLLFMAYACYVAMCSLYIAVSPYMKKVYGVANGERPPYPGLEQDGLVLIKLVFVSFILFWMTLWCVKFSLLFLYRTFLVGLTKRYTVTWWVILGLCVFTHAGNYAFYFRSCGGTMSEFFNGGCVGNKAKSAQFVSLYYSLAADTLTNLLIMALPIKLTWNLQIDRAKKNAILLLFASGFICILFASIRVGQVAMNAAKPEADGQPLEPTWLAVWGIIECSVAVIIGCCPAFTVLINASRAKTTYNSRSYRMQGESQIGKADSNQVQLKSIRSNSTKKWRHHSKAETRSVPSWADAHGSEEELRKSYDGILVSTMLTQEFSLVDPDQDSGPSRESAARRVALDTRGEQ